METWLEMTAVDQGRDCEGRRWREQDGKGEWENPFRQSLGGEGMVSKEVADGWTAEGRRKKPVCTVKNRRFIALV